MEDRHVLPQIINPIHSLPCEKLVTRCCWRREAPLGHQPLNGAILRHNPAKQSPTFSSQCQRNQSLLNEASLTLQPMKLPENPNTEKLLQRILDSFAATIPPASSNIIRWDSLGILEAQEIAAAFQGRDWRSASNEMLAAHKHAPAYFSDEAFVHFLPGYMRLIVQDIEAADVATDTILAQLTLPTVEDAQAALATYQSSGFEVDGLEDFYKDEIQKIELRLQQFLTKVALFSPRQSACIFQFLQHLQTDFSGGIQDKQISNAIERYWGQFANA